MTKNCESQATTINRHKPLKEITAGEFAELMNERTNKRKELTADEAGKLMKESECLGWCKDDCPKIAECKLAEYLNKDTGRREFDLFDDSNDVVTELKQHLTLFAELANYYHRKFIDAELQGAGYDKAESIKTHLLNAMYEVSEIVASETAQVYFWDKVKCDIN